MRTIVTSPEFFSRAAYRAKVKTPFEVVASALRAWTRTPDTTPRIAQVVARLGQPIFGHQTPDGWPETRRRVDEHRRDPQPHQLRARASRPVACPVRALADWPAAPSAARAPREQQVDARDRARCSAAQVSPDTRQVLLSGENPLLAADAGATTRRDAPAIDSRMRMRDVGAPGAARRAGGRGARDVAQPCSRRGSRRSSGSRSAPRNSSGASAPSHPTET